jgi:hypothetical protein
MSTNRTAVLQWLNGLEPKTYPLNPAKEISIGQAPTCDIAVTSGRNGNIAQRHAVIRYCSDSGSFEIRDLGSLQGTYVNQQRLDDRQLLQPGDRIQLGDRGAEFQFDQLDLPLSSIDTTTGATKPSLAWGNPSAPVNANRPTAVIAPLVTTVPIVPALSSGKPLLMGLALLLSASLFVALALFRGLPPWDQLQQPLFSAKDSSAGSSAQVPAELATQTYSDPNGQFQVNLPADYAIESRTNGINIASADSSFQGAINVITVPRQITAADMIQAFVEQQGNNANLQEFVMQNSTEVEGGVRIDWIARLANTETKLDAITHFIQQGNLLVEVDLFSVDRPFAQQDAVESNIILHSLRIGQ